MRVCSGSPARAIGVIVIALLFTMRGEVSSADAAHSDTAAPQARHANHLRQLAAIQAISCRPAMQALFSGEYFWKLPADVQLEVGPTMPMPLPPAYLADTEKNASRVTLKKLPDAGYIPEGYVTGIPFPNPLSQSALAPYAIFYDLYYHYNPRLQRLYLL